MSVNPGLLSLSVLAGVLFLSGCRRTQLPTEDKTPPSRLWIIKHSKGGQERFEEGQCNPKCPIVTQLTGETLDITFYASDPEGVHEIILGSGSENGVAGSYVCLVQATPHAESLTLSPKEDKGTFNPDSGGYVETSRFLKRTVGVNLGATCQSDSTYKEGHLTLVGTGENFFKGKVTSQLTICSPECKIQKAP